MNNVSVTYSDINANVAEPYFAWSGRGLGRAF